MSETTKTLSEQEIAVLSSLVEMALARAPVTFAEWFDKNSAFESVLKGTNALLQGGIQLHAGKREAEEMSAELKRLAKHIGSFHTKQKRLINLMEEHALARIAHARAKDAKDEELARVHDTAVHVVQHKIIRFVDGDENESEHDG